MGYVRPNFATNNWLEIVELRDPDSWPASWKFFLRLPVTYYLAAFFVFMAVAHTSVLLHISWLALLLMLCLLPVIGLVVGVIYISRKVVREKDDGSTKVGLAAEFIASKKEGWCKLVEIK